MKKAVGFIEFKSIPIGIEATDDMLKAGNVDLMMASPLCPGKYVTIISGDVGAVQASIRNGEHIGGIYVLESHVIPNIHPDVLPAMLGAGEIEDVKALGIVETIKQAIKAAEADMRDLGVITSYSVIASPHKDIKKVIF